MAKRTTANWNALFKILSNAAGRPIDRENVFTRLGMTFLGYKRDDRDRVRPIVRLRHYRAIADAARSFRDLIDQAKASRGLRGEQVFELVEGFGQRQGFRPEEVEAYAAAKGLALQEDGDYHNAAAGAEENPDIEAREVLEWLAEDEFDAALAAVKAIETAALAIAAAESRRVQSGAQPDLKLRSLVLALAPIFEETTGRPATTTDGKPFHLFCIAAFKIIGEIRTAAGLLTTIKTALRAQKREALERVEIEQADLDALDQMIRDRQ